MVYPNRVIFDGNEITYIPVDNEWVLANKPNTLLLSADKATLVVDDLGTDKATITVQLQTPELIDGSHDCVVADIDVEITVNGGSDTVSLIDGVGTFTVGAVFPKSFIVTGESHTSNELTIEAT